MSFGILFMLRLEMYLIQDCRVWSLVIRTRVKDVGFRV
jgi:hypothetical protein